MAIDLETALACLEEWRRAREAVDATAGSATYAFVDGVPIVVTEALRIVLARARENLAAETVAKANALSARALEMARREERDRGMQGAACVWCGKPTGGGNHCGNVDCAP